MNDPINVTNVRSELTGSNEITVWIDFPDGTTATIHLTETMARKLIDAVKDQVNMIVAMSGTTRSAVTDFVK